MKQAVCKMAEKFKRNKKREEYSMVVAPFIDMGWVHH